MCELTLLKRNAFVEGPVSNMSVWAVPLEMSLLQALSAPTAAILGLTPGGHNAQGQGMGQNMSRTALDIAQDWASFHLHALEGKMDLPTPRTLSRCTLEKAIDPHLAGYCLTHKH